MNLSRRAFGMAAAAAALGGTLGRAGRASEQPPPAGPPKRYGRLRDVNTTDIGAAIALGCRTMGSVFNPLDDGVPFFASSVRPRPFLAFNPDHTEAHVPGRHLNALLHAEAVTGKPANEAAVEQHARAAFLAYGGPVALPLNREQPGGKPTRFLPHNLREGFHALYALAKYRNSAKARETAERSIAAIAELWSPEGGWDRKRIEGDVGLRLIEWPGPFITGIARAIGPLVKYFAATGHGPALRLAMRLKEKALAECFLPDGGYDPARFGTHTHSTTCVTSSLAQLAELTGDASLMARVRRFFDDGLTRISDPIGWSIENTSERASPDRGEANNTGDILETAMILGRSGYPEYYERAELILRAHLLPSQLRDTAFIDAAVPTPGGGPGIAERHLGAFGFPAPYGHQPLGFEDVSFNLDIVGGAVDSLSAALEHVVTSGPDGTRVNLLFDRETPAVKVESPYTSPGGKLRLAAKTPGPVWLRLPGWADRKAVTVDPGAGPAIESNGYLVFPEMPVGRAVTVGIPLPERQVVLKHRTRDIRVRLRGDAVTAMDDFGADLTFFEPLA